MQQRWCARTLARTAVAVALLMVVASGSLPAASAATSPTLRITPAAPFRAETFTASTTLPTRVRRPVQLQRAYAGRWVRVASSTASSTGTARVTWRTTAAREVLRVLAPRHRAGGRTYAPVVSRQATVVTAGQVAALEVSRDAQGRVDARVTASQVRPGRGVYLQVQQADGSWRTVAATRMGSSRAVSFADVMTVEQARGQRLRGLLGGWQGAGSVATPVHLPPTVTVESRVGTDENVVTAATTGAVSRVRFFLDGRLLAEDTSAPWRATWPRRPGAHDVVARAVGPIESVLSTAHQVRTPEQAVADTGVASGYVLETVQSGLDLPTSAAVTGTGAVLVTEKAGLVRVLEPEDESGWSRPRTVLDLRDRVYDADDAGLIGIAVDPGFAENGFVYLSYVLDDGRPDQRTRSQQVARYRWDGNRLDPGSRHVVLGAVTGEACYAPANVRTPDCVPLSGNAHTIGELAFDEDGHLLVGIGDGALYLADGGLRGRPEAMRAQDPEVLAGKVLRIDPSTGRGVPGNPLYDGTGASNASRVLAMGFRNPFRFTVSGDRLVVGDVGESSVEELDVVPLGTGGAAPNYGWPCFEGRTTTDLPGFEDDDSPWHGCAAVRAGGDVEPPALAYPHSGGGSVTAGVFLDSEAYPADMRGRYVFGDYAQNFIRTADITESGEVTAVARLADSTAADGPVKFLTGPDGLAWVLSIYSGSLRRLRHVGTGTGDRCAPNTFRRTFHDLDGPGSAFDAEYPDDEWRWLFPYVAAQLPPSALAPATCEPRIQLSPTSGSPWTTAPDTRDHPGDRFGTAWRGRVDLEAGTHRFTVRGSEWVRLWIDDELVHDFYSSDFWPVDARQHDVVLSEGQHTLRAEHVHGDQQVAATDISWQRVGGPPTVSVTTPVNGAVAVAGAVDWSVRVSDPDGDDPQALTARTELSADFLHYSGDSFHAHPITRVVGRSSGSFVVDGAHAPGQGVVRLRATTTDASGARTTSAPVYVCLPDSPAGPCGD